MVVISVAKNLTTRCEERGMVSSTADVGDYYVETQGFR